MIVCVCKNVAHSVLREAVEQGCETVRDLQAKTGACTQCKKCAVEVVQTLRAAKGQSVVGLERKEAELY